MKKTILIFLIMVLSVNFASAENTSNEFRVNPIWKFTVSPESIEAGQEAIAEMYVQNPFENDVTLNGDVSVYVNVTSGIHFYSESFGQVIGYGKVAGTFSVPPGTARTISTVIKANKSARIGSHTIQFTALYWSGDNKDNFQPQSLTYPVTIKEPTLYNQSEPILDIQSEPISGKPSASVQLHGEKTDVVRGEDIILKLSAINVIPNPNMTVQVILIPPSGMSATASEFVTSGAGQYTTTYTLETGNGKDIEVRIKTNQIGNFKVQGRIIYYYGGNTSTKEDYTLTLPITVRPVETTSLDLQALETQKSPGASVAFTLLIFGILHRLIKSNYNFRR